MHELYTQTHTSMHMTSERWCSPLKALCCRVLSSYHGYCTFWNHTVYKILTPSKCNTLKWSVSLPFKHPFYMMNVLEQHSTHSAPSAPGTPYCIFVTLWAAPWPRMACPHFCLQKTFNSAAGVHTVQSIIETLCLQSHLLLWQLRSELFQREPQRWLVTYRRLPW